MECCVICRNLLDCGNIIRKIKESDPSVLAYIEADRQCHSFEMNETSRKSETVQNRFKTLISELLEIDNES